MFIVFDLEWNQSADGKDGTVPGLPFEIIEIGAVKLNDKLEIVDEFSRLIKPVVYPRLHFRILEIVNIDIDELNSKGQPFAEAFSDFMKFCGDDPVFCTWGESDLTHLQRNVVHHGIPNPFPYPLMYYNLQKLYSRLYMDNIKPAPPLDQAVEFFGIKKDRAFHRALDDAVYTARVMKAMDFDSVKEYLSLDYYRVPQSKDEELFLVFPDYTKYVTRTFDSKEELIDDKTVTDVTCLRCKRILKKRVRWFSPNPKQYLCVAKCPVHGYVKSKIRIKYDDEERMYAVKTTKMTSEETAVEIALKKQETTRNRAEKRRRRKRK